MKKVICWFSGGVTSAVACKLTIDHYGKDNCQSIFIDTGNEDDDTYRFKKDCEEWLGIEIETITGLTEELPDIQSVWRKYKSLNVAHGAICSSVLKRDVRLKWEKENEYLHQVFGFDIDETNRAKSMTMNYPKAKAIYPLLLHGMSKNECIDLIQDAGIEIPEAYKLGYNNNNCKKTGCIQGGIGYWQKIRREDPAKFEEMAAMEHELTDAKGKPVTMLKDQSKGGGLLFLMPHPDYPDVKDISMKKGREPIPLMDCNGFGCAVNDLMPQNKTELEINFQTTLF